MRNDWLEMMSSTYDVLLVLFVASQGARHLLKDGVRVFRVKQEDSFTRRTFSVYTRRYTRRIEIQLILKK